MKVLVTGGLGFIGSHVVTVLKDSGHDVVIVDNLVNSERSVLDGLQKIIGKKPTFYELDYRNNDRLAEIIAKDIAPANQIPDIL